MKQTKPLYKQKRGFALISLELRRAIASSGGKAAHASGNAHEWNSDEAAAAGQIGGRKRKKVVRTVSGKKTVVVSNYVSKRATKRQRLEYLAKIEKTT